MMVFKRQLSTFAPKYVSCIIQINIDDSWVSDSPYIHVFIRLMKSITKWRKIY